MIAVVATDAPFFPSQCKALTRRVSLGLARTGAIGGRSSGDMFLAVCTANEGAFSRNTPKNHTRRTRRSTRTAPATTTSSLSPGTPSTRSTAMPTALGRGDRFEWVGRLCLHGCVPHAFLSG